MSKKQRFVYDTETCTYKEDKLTTREILTKAVIVAALGVGAGALMFLGYVNLGDDPKTKFLKEQNASLSSRVTEYNQKLAALETKVDELHTKDNEFYRSLLNAKPLEEGEWTGGKGGSNDFAFANHPQVLQETEKKLEILDYKIQLQHRSYEHLKEVMEENKDRLKSIPAIRPVAGSVISGFGVRFHPVLRIRKEHTGLDFVAQIGTPISATGDGKVITAGMNGGGYGNQIEIDHGHGFVTKYAHLSQIKVNVGQEVKRGDLIGLTGNTGLSSGPHLHYEILKNGTKIDPIDYFYGELSPKEYEVLRKAATSEANTME